MENVLKKMAKNTRVSRAEYKNLAEALGHAKRSGKVIEYSAPAVLARVLLEAFLYEDGDIKAEWFVSEKACTKGNFTKLRDRLVKDGWLHFREDTRRYFAGTRLRSHLDVVMSAKTVTFADLERKADKVDIADLEAKKADKSAVEDLNNSKADRSELQDLKVRMNEIADAVKQLQKASIPPDDKEKKAMREDATAKLGKLAAVN